MADATPLAFVGTETTGPDPDQHEIWEVAIITWPEGAEHAWLLPVEHLAWADAKALGLGNFHRRHPQGNEFFAMNGAILARDRGHLASELAQLTHGRHLVGMGTASDTQRLERLLRSENVAPSWGYHLVDMEALVAGSLGLPPPWRSTELSRKLDVEPDDFDRHTALGDCRWALAVYQAWVTRCLA